MGDRFKLWLLELRAPFFTASVAPVVLGAAIAWENTGGFHPGYFLLTLLGGVLLHAGTNVANDYFDHRSRCDDINVEFVSPFTGGSRLIQEGLLTPREVLTEALICFGLGSLIGLYLTFVRGPLILALGVVGIISGFFYTAPPLNIASRGVGEFFVGLNFGLLMTLGSYYVQTGSLAWEPLVAAIPLASLIAGVLWINEFQDAPADRAVGKETLVVRLGRRRAVNGYIALLLIPYLSVALGVLLRITSPFTLFVLLTIPLAKKAVEVARLHYQESQRLVPANAATIQIHMLTGVLLTVAYFIEGAI